MDKTLTTPSDKTNTPKKTPANTTQTIKALPLTTTEPVKLSRAGRPTKLEMPALPKMPMSDVEQGLFDYFLAAYHAEYPDLSPTDHLLLHLAGLEYVKYLRVIAEELETGHVLTMSRQHPGVNMRALLDQLSVTRKARTSKAKPDENDDEKEFKDFFMNMGRNAKKRA